MLKTIFLSLLLLVSACSTPSPTGSVSNEPKQKLSFIDINNFDRELTASLNAPLDSVDVVFYEKSQPQQNARASAKVDFSR